MEKHSFTFFVIFICLILLGFGNYYDSVSVNNTDLKQFIGKWGAPREQFYFAQTKDGLSMSIYRSPEETLIRDGHYLRVKNMNSLQYVENAGGQLIFKDGHLVFDYCMTDKQKLLFTFQRKNNNTYYFMAQNETGEHKLKLSVYNNYLTFNIVSQGHQDYLFRGDKMNY